MSCAWSEEFPAPSRQGTDSSHYSCSGLPVNDPARYLNASEVRRQVQEAPNKKVRIPAASGPSARRPLAKYPSTFKNTENLPLASQTPRQEYPVFSTGSWNSEARDSAGLARAVYNNRDRAIFDVTYHDPRKGSHNGGNVSIAPYRPAADARSGGASK